MMYDVNRVREDFPILSREIYGRPLVYLDNGATTQKPRQVVEAMVDEYYNVNANVHRGVHYLSEQMTERMEQARDRVRRFIGADKVSEIIFTRGTTESINLVASSFGELLHEGDEIIITAQADQFTADGILQLAWVLQGFQGLPGTNFTNAGILLTRFSERSTIRREMRDAISAIAKDLDTKVYNTFIRENVAIVESQFLHSSVYKHNKRSNGAIDYYNFVKEFLMDHGVQESEIPEFIKPEV